MMTREEAIIIIERVAHTEAKWPGTEDTLEALDMALTALRPVSRERVEKVWRGEWQKDIPMGYKCNSCEGLIVGQTPFCPVCGKAMTDEAVEMVMERMDALHDTEN